LRALCRGQDTLRPPRHFGGSAAGEGQQQKPLWYGAIQDQTRNPMRQRVCLTGASAGDNQKWAGNLPLPTIRNTVLDSLPLSDVQTAQICRGIHVKCGLADLLVIRRRAASRPFRRIRPPNGQVNNRQGHRNDSRVVVLH